MANNWQDVLGVYATKTVSDEDVGTEVITLNPEKIEELKSVHGHERSGNRNPRGNEYHL